MPRYVLRPKFFLQNGVGVVSKQSQFTIFYLSLFNFLYIVSNSQEQPEKSVYAQSAVNIRLSTDLYRYIRIFLQKTVCAFAKNFAHCNILYMFIK